MYIVDTETVGFHGVAVLLQYSRTNEKDIHLWNIWEERVGDTLEIIKDIADKGVIGFNLAFDWFHLCKLYTMFSLFEDKKAWPIDHIDELAIIEERARFQGCLKPRHALDLWLHAIKGPYQSLMGRDDIRVKRVPTILAESLVEELNRRIKFEDIYFYKKKDRKKRWSILEIKNDMGEPVPDLKDLKLEFQPSSQLKTLAAHILGSEDVITFDEVTLSDKVKPLESGFAPFALALGKPGEWNWTWPEVLEYHTNHWYYDTKARQYASDDVKYTRLIYEHFGQPEPDDTDSTLACMVGAVRWAGFAINTEAIAAQKTEQEKFLEKLTFNHNAPHECRDYLAEVMTPVERSVISTSTKKEILNEIAVWKINTICPECKGLGSSLKGKECVHCNGSGEIESDEQHPAALRADVILKARFAVKRIEMFDKLLRAGRLHASLKVIGALSSRMAGADGLNVQGIAREKVVRSTFPLADNGMVLSGGDFDGFEVTIAEAAYQDPLLREDLKSGKKIHALFGQFLFPELGYDGVLASKSKSGSEDKYSLSKSGLFALIYQGNEYTLQTKLGVTQERAEGAVKGFFDRYKVVAEKRKKYAEMFCSMKQPNGLGTKVEWDEPHDYIESLTGFRRYFTLENQIVKALFELANDPPEEWQKLKIKITRRQERGQQLACNAVRSALFAAAFGLQAANMRAAGNHVIQSTGATVTKDLQARIWSVQPVGYSPWLVKPLNVHDEVMCPTHKDYLKVVHTVVDDFVESIKPLIPLVGMEWQESLDNWSDK